MASSERDPRFDVPLYTISEAAMHLRMSDETLRRWVNRGDLIRSLTPETPKSARLPFIAMAEAQFYLQLRRDGLSMQSVTTGMAAARQLLGARFLVRGALAHDGKDVLLNLPDRDAASEWLRARDRQGGLPGVIERGLTHITWGPDDRPERVRLVAYEGADVIVDPRFVFGQPMLAERGVRTEDILQMFLAGDSIEDVAEEFRVPAQVVESIVRTHALAA
ncbi:DUF433 domain-containing protein [Pengzhenrongella sp.]|jgi:uncharacterized protein (DUF433 family)|uniref:DUF433 domain-containing protein n=1 Tax=Pengzhenrongella sp. TaxID=2888820 RepID=UPI002F93CC26